EKVFVGGVLAGTAVALSLVVQNHQRRRVFPFHQIPGNQRVLGFGTAEEVRAFFAIVLFPLGEQLAAIAVAHLRDKAIGGAFDRAIAKWIHGDADRHLGERVAFFGAR